MAEQFVAAEWEDVAPAKFVADEWETVDPKKVQAYEKYAETLSTTPPWGLGEYAAAKAIPAEDRELVKSLIAQRYASDQTMKNAGYGTRLATSLTQGMVDFGLPLAKMVPGFPSLDPDQERFKQEMIGIREGIDPTIRPDTNELGQAAQQTARMGFPMVQSVGAGKTGGATASLMGGGPRAVQVGTALGTSGSFLPQTADQTYTSLIGEGVDPNTAANITAVSAPIEAALESILTDPLSPYLTAFKGSARQVAGKFLKEFAKNYGKELTEEGLQGIVNETALEVGRQLDEQIPDKGLGNILNRGVSEMQQAALPLLLMMGPGTSIGAVQTAQESAARKARLEQLQQIRSKGFVAENDGIEGGSRKERMANLREEEQQIRKEIQDAEVPTTDEVVTEEAGQTEVPSQAGIEGQAEVPVDRFTGMTPEQVQQHQAMEAEVGQPVMTPSEEAAYQAQAAERSSAFEAAMAAMAAAEAAAPVASESTPAAPKQTATPPVDAQVEDTPAVSRSKIERDADRVVELDSRIDKSADSPERDSAILIRDKIRGKYDSAEFDPLVEKLKNIRKEAEEQERKDRKAQINTPEHRAVVARGRIRKDVERMQRKGVTENTPPREGKKPLGRAVWTSEDGTERPVVVSHVSGIAGNEVFVAIKGSDTSVPLSQIRFEGEQAQAKPTPEAMASAEAIEPEVPSPTPPQISYRKKAQQAQLDREGPYEAEAPERTSKEQVAAGKAQRQRKVSFKTGKKIVPAESPRTQLQSSAFAAKTAKPEPPKATEAITEPEAEPEKTQYKRQSSLDESEKKHHQEEMQFAREQELELVKRRDLIQKQKDGTRRNAHKKKGELQGQINNLERQISDQRRRFNRNQNVLRLEELEDYLEKAPSETHLQAGLAEQAELNYQKWREIEQASPRGDKMASDEADRFQSVRSQHEHNVQAEFLQEAGKLSDQFNKDEITGIAEHARRDFSITSRSTVSQLVEKYSKMVKEARNFDLAESKTAFLSDEQKSSFRERMKAAAQGGKDWRKDYDAVVKEAEAANDKAFKSKQKTDAAEAEEKAAAQLERDKEAAIERRRVRREEATAERYFRQAKERAKKLKSGKWKIVENKDAAKDEPKFTVIHSTTDLALTGTDKKTDAQVLVQMIDDAGIEIPDTEPKADDPEMKRLKELLHIWDTEQFGEADVGKHLAGMVEIPEAGVKGDIELDASDLIPKGQSGINPKLKEFIREVQEFAYNPVFTVNEARNLVFKDGFTFELNPSFVGLDRSMVEPGQTVALNLPDVGIQRPTPENLVKDVLSRDFSVKSGGKKGGLILRRLGKPSGDAIKVSGGGQNWSVTSGLELPDGKRAQQLLDGISWIRSEQIEKNQEAAEVTTPDSVSSLSGMHLDTYKALQPSMDKHVAAETSGRRKVFAVIDAASNEAPQVQQALIEHFLSENPDVDIESAKGMIPIGLKKWFTREAPKSKLQEAADKATQEAIEASKALHDEIKGIGKRANSNPLDPAFLARAGIVVGKWAKAGTYQFAAMIEKLTASIGKSAVDLIQPALEVEWDKAVASGDYPKMEPRVKKPAGSGSTTGTKNVKTDELREQTGMGERPPVEPESVEEWQDKAAKRIAKDPQYPGKLAAELSANPRAIDNLEEAVLGRHIRDLKNRHKAGEDVSDELRTAVEASERAGTIWGRAGVSRQTELNADFSIEGLVRQHMRGTNALPSDEQMEKYSELADKIENLEGQLKAALEAKAQAEVDKAIAEAKSKKPASVPRKGTKREQLQQKASEAVSAFKNEWSKLFQMGAISDPKQDAEKWFQITKAAGNVIKAYAELGIDSFLELMSRVKTDFGTLTSDQRDAFREAWTEAQAAKDSTIVEKPDPAAIGTLARRLTRFAVESGIEERDAVVDAVHDELTRMGFEVSRSDTMAAISGYGDFRELSKDEVSVKVRGIKGEIQQVLKLEDMQAGQAPAKTGVERRTPTDEERRLIKEVNEAKKRGGYTVTDPDRQLASALTAAKTAARNRITDLEHAISTREKIVSGQTKLTPDSELTQLRERRDALNAEYQRIFPVKKNGFSDAQRLKMAEALLDRHIAELQADLDAGRLGPKEKKARLTSPEIEAKREQLEALKAVREEARAASPEYQAQEAAKQTERYKQALQRQLSFWEQRRDEAAAGKLPEKRKPSPVDNEILETKYQIEQVRRHARAEMEEAERAARGKVGKALGFGGDLLDLARAIQTGYEMSAVLRQGAFYTLGFPKQAFPAVWKSIQAAFSRRADFALHDDLMARPNHVDYVRGGLETTAADGPLSSREELLRSRFATWLAQQEGSKWALPRWASEGLLGSERAFRSFLNTMRADLFDYMKDSIEANRPGTWSEDDAQIIGHASNVFSGRGKLPGNASGVGLSRIFYAPRWVWSRGQLLVGQPLWKGNAATRKAVGKVYVRAALGMGAYMLIRHAIYSLLAGDDDEPKYEIDPRSSDFGKTRLGETRIDSGTGFNQLVTLAARIITGETKRASGEIVPIRGDEVPYGGDNSADIITRFLRTKLAPLPSGVLDFATGENVVGEKTTVGKLVSERVTPMTWRDIWEAEQELNVPQGTVAALEAFFGAGVSTYGPETSLRNAETEEERRKVLKKNRNLKKAKAKANRGSGSR